MTMFKKIMLSISRRKSKSILLFLAFLILGTFVGTSALVNQASNQMISQVEDSFDFYAYLRKTEEVQFYDYQEYNEMQDSKYDLYMQLKKLEGIEDTNLQLSARANGMFHADIDYTNFSYIDKFYDGSVKFLGIEPEASLIQQNLFEIIEGRNLALDDTNAIVINETMTYKDGSVIQIGDHINVTYRNFNERLDDNDEYVFEVFDSKDYDFEVVGRYHLKNELKDELAESNLLYWESDTLVSFQTLLNMRNEIAALHSSIENLELVFSFTNERFKLDSYQNQVNFVDSFNQINGDNPIFELVTSDDGFEEVKDKLDNTIFISKLSLCISIFASVFIGALTIYLYLKDRKHEVGILLALGENKKAIISQFMAEILFLSLVAFVVSMGTSSMFGQSLIEKQRASFSMIHIKQGNMTIYNGIYLLLGGCLVSIFATIYTTKSMMKKKIKELL